MNRPREGLSGFAANLRARLMIAWCLSLAATAAGQTGAFVFDPISEPILSADLCIDTAALVAHRYVGGSEVNSLRLFDVAGGGSVDLSDALFGAASWPASPAVSQDILETGWLTASIHSGDFPALANGNIGLDVLLTDTDDGMFAIDCFILRIVTDQSTIYAHYGWPTGEPNDGFGLGAALPDYGDLPAPLPTSLPVGATGVGFDETIGSLAIYVPEPTTFGLLMLAGGWLTRRRQAPSAS